MSLDYRLARSAGQIEEYIADFQSDRLRVTLDCEASSLDVRKAVLAGYSLSLKEGTGIYVPIGHTIGVNIPIDEALKPIRTLDAIGYTFQNYNSKYDRTVMERNADFLPMKFLDVMELVYMDDPDRFEKGLKYTVKKEYGIEMVDFESLFTPQEIKSKQMDIRTKLPAKVCEYACADADFTDRLSFKFGYVEKDFAFAVQIDTELVDIVRAVERDGGMELNPKYVDEKIEKLRGLEIALREQIIRATGYVFEIDSPKQLGIAMFDRLGYPNEGRTKKGQYKTDSDVMEKLADTYPVVEWVVSYRKVKKALQTYFAKLKRLEDLKVKPRFNFNIYAAPTFRFSAPGGDPLEDGATGINIQAVSNGEMRDIPGVLLNRKTVVSDKIVLDEEDVLVQTLAVPENLTTKNWAGMADQIEKITEDFPYVLDAEDGRVCIRDVCVGCPTSCQQMGIDITRRRVKDVRVIPSVRQAFKAPEGYSLLSGDFDKQEMLIGANLSGERLWLDAIKAGEDLHKTTTLAAYGIPSFVGMSKEEAKAKRDVGKMINFLVFFGGNDKTLARRANIPQATATQIYETARHNLVSLFRWIEKVQQFARANGFTTTYFNRRRWLRQFYAMPDKKMHSFADRSAVNTCIQGTGADITRIAMVRVNNWIKKVKASTSELRLVMQVHDELMFLIRNDLIPEIAPMIRERMEVPVKAWEVQLTVSMSAGPIWGLQEALALPR